MSDRATRASSGRHRFGGAVPYGVLDRWTADTLDEEIRRTFGAEAWAHTRGWVLERVFAHDVSHVAELNDALSRAGLPQVDLWG